MRADAGRRLAELGIDRYVLRSAHAAAPATEAPARVSPAGPGPAPAPATAVAASAPGTAARVLLYAGTGGAGALLADIGRSLSLLRLDWAPGVEDDAAVSSAAGFVVLGEDLARRVAAGLPTDRLGACEWIIAGQPADLARGAAAKRALWGELKRLARTLSARDAAAKH